MTSRGAVAPYLRIAYVLRAQVMALRREVREVREVRDLCE